MAGPALRVLHAIHDFLPKNQAGSEIYAHALCRALLDRGHHVTVVCADFDPSRPHGHVRWRVHDEVPVAEIANNWLCSGFEDTYRPALVGERLASVLHAVQPHVVHVHSLLNLSFDLPRLARQRGARVVATLHDYTLVCPSGGQRLHRAAAHICHNIEPQRCARCFSESPLGSRAAFGRLAVRPGIAAPLAAAARLVRAVAPSLAAAAGHQLPALPATAGDIDRRLEAARALFDDVDRFVSPSASLAREYLRLGMPAEKLTVADYGFSPRHHARPARACIAGEPVRMAFVGTPVWHKGLHVLLDAARRLPGDAYTVTVHGDMEVFPDYAADLRRRAAGLPVRFAGPFGRSRVEQVFDQIDLLVVPSLWLENSPLVIHEAQLAGVPVVGSEIGGIPDLVVDGLNGLLVPPGDAAALAGALQRITTDPPLLARLAAAAPGVRTLDEDADDWERHYRAVIGTVVPVPALS